MAIFPRKKSIQELEEENEYQEKELSIMEKLVLKKQLEARGQSLDSFKLGGKTVWSRVKNWLKSH